MPVKTEHNHWLATGRVWPRWLKRATREAWQGLTYPLRFLRHKVYLALRKGAGLPAA